MQQRNGSGSRIAIYSRVSSKSQDTASQDQDLKKYAAAHGSGVRWFRDTFTGKTMERPGWSKLWRAIERGEIDQVTVWRIDRLGRTASGLTKLFDDLRRLKINLVSLRDGIDLNTTAGRLLANVLASVSQFETEVRGERIAAGQIAARARGVRWGGSKRGRMIKVNEDQVRLIRRMKSEGAGVSSIARAVSLSRPTIYRLLG